MSKTQAHDHDSESEKHDAKKKPSSSFGGIVLAAVLILAFIILFKFLFFSGEKKTPESNNNTPQKETPVKEKEVVYTPYQYVRHVDYGSDYGNSVKIPNESTFAFVKATEPYCCKNLSTEEPKCGEAEEDITDQLGLDDQLNKELWFKSQNGKNGGLDIVITVNPKKK